MQDLGLTLAYAVQHPHSEDDAQRGPNFALAAAIVEGCAAERGRGGKLQVSSCKLQVSSYKLQVSSCKLQVSSYKLQVAKLRSCNVTSYRYAAERGSGGKPLTSGEAAVSSSPLL